MSASLTVLWCSGFGNRLQKCWFHQ